MGLNLLTYRLFRLRRLVLVSLLPTWAYLVWMWPGLSPVDTQLFALIALLPLLHLLIYPSAWTETLSVTVAALFMLWLGSLIDPDMPLDARVLRYGLIFLAGFLLFLPLIWITAVFLFIGGERSYVLRARMRSHLPMADLKAAMTYYPGRSDEFVTCGVPDADGVFPVTLHVQEFDALPETEFDFGADAVVNFADDGMVQPDFDMRCKIDRDEDDAVDVVFFTPHDPNPGVTSHRFQADGTGTIVEYAERGAPLTPILRLGLFLQDFVGDYLQSQIELAEGRARVSNRSFPARQFIVDVARLIPAEDQRT